MRRPRIPRSCPIGKGMIQRCFTLLEASEFRGPIKMQSEYPFANPSLDARVRALVADNAHSRAWIQKA